MTVAEPDEEGRGPEAQDVGIPVSVEISRRDGEGELKRELDRRLEGSVAVSEVHVDAGQKESLEGEVRNAVAVEVGRRELGRPVQVGRVFDRRLEGPVAVAEKDRNVGAGRRDVELPVAVEVGCDDRIRAGGIDVHHGGEATRSRPAQEPEPVADGGDDVRDPVAVEVTAREALRVVGLKGSHRGRKGRVETTRALSEEARTCEDEQRQTGDQSHRYPSSVHPLIRRCRNYIDTPQLAASSLKVSKSRLTPSPFLPFLA